MKAIYHRLAAKDVRAIMDYYSDESGPGLAERFLAEFLRTVEKACGNPRCFPPLDGPVRRANLDGFPYHFLYEERSFGIRVMVVRHHRRNPDYGLRRR